MSGTEKINRISIEEQEHGYLIIDNTSGLSTIQRKPPSCGTERPLGYDEIITIAMCKHILGQ